MNQKDYWEAAAEAIRATGARVTSARARVLALLLSGTEALSEPQIESQLDGPRLDCVTIYRVLEWLAEVRLVHRMAGQDGVWRFAPLPNGEPPHAVFECDQCRRVLPLFDADLPRATLPDGYRAERTLLYVFGRCPVCVSADTAAQAHPSTA